MTPRAERQEQHRADIYEAAARLIAERGFHGMSMRDLATATGCGVSSLYNYFASKEELLATLQARAFETLIQAASESLRDVVDPSARLYIFIFNQVRYFIEHPDVMRVLVHEAAALPATHRQKVRSLKVTYFRIGRDAVSSIYAQGCGSSDATPRGVVSDAELERATYSLFGMINWVWAWYEPQQHGSAEDVARSIHSLALCGLVSRCPTRQIQDDLSPALAASVAPSLTGRAAAPVSLSV